MAKADATAFTYGWDTVFGIPIPDANKAIIDHKSSPTGCNYTEDDFSFTCSFGNWQIFDGGSGRNIRFSIPMSELVLVMNTGTDENKVTCDSGTAVIEVNMQYIPHTESAASDGVKCNPMALIVNSKQTAPDQPPAVMVSFELSQDVGVISKAVMSEGLTEWLNANLDEFNHIFAVVDLNRMIDKGNWGFVTPNYTSYAYLDGESLNDSILGVLTMTGDRTGDSLACQISNNVIPGKSEAGFLVSQERTLADVIRPAIMQLYTNLTDKDFLLNDAGTTLYLKDGVTVDINPVEHGGETYYPVLKQLSVESDGKTLTLQSYTETEIITGITACCTATNWYTIELGECDNGQTLKFVETQPGDVQHTIHQSKGSVITELIISIVAAVALLILGIVTDGAAFVVGGLIIGLIMGADMIIPSVIQLVNKDTSPAIDLLQVNAVDPIKWTDGKDFKLDYAGLNVSLQLGGDPKFI